MQWSLCGLHGACLKDAQPDQQSMCIIEQPGHWFRSKLWGAVYTFLDSPVDPRLQHRFLHLPGGVSHYSVSHEARPRPAEGCQFLCHPAQAQSLQVLGQKCGSFRLATLAILSMTPSHHGFGQR